MLTFQNFTQRGRLGNQMFRVASTIGIATKNGHDYAFPQWVCDRSKVDYEPFFANPLPRLDPEVRIQRRISEERFSYQDIRLPEGNFTLFGYFQTERYFAHCADVVRRYMEPRAEIKKRLVDNYGSVVEGSCSLHVRRTDYVHQQSHHPMLSMDYYERAMRLVSESTGVSRFVVFSDDPKWCRENLKGDLCFVEGNRNIEDIFLMSMCSHHIIANSSFSWWGAWLNPNPNKLVVAPSLWFGPDLKQHDTTGVTPKSWIRM
jgi:hypothetical protein